MILLSISDNHDSGAALIIDKEIIAAVNEERLTRKKLIGGFPYRSVEEVLRIAKVLPSDIDVVVVASTMTPCFLLRSLETFHNTVRNQSSSFSYLLNLYIIYQVFAHKAVLPQAAEEFFSKKVLRKKISAWGIKAPIVMVDHHCAHAAAAYYTQGDSRKTLIITADSMGDALSVTVSIGEGNRIQRIFSQTGFSSMSTYYSRLTEFLGFKPLRHEGKITGLAGYGKHNKDIVALAKKNLCFVEHNSAFNRKNHFLPERSDNRIYAALRRYSKEDVAYNFQNNFENEIVAFVDFWVKKTRVGNVVLSGGAFANVSVNKRICEIPDITKLYIFPHMGDGGLSVGASLFFLKPEPSRLKNIYLGSDYTNESIGAMAKKSGLRHVFLQEEDLCKKIAQLLFEGKTIAHFNGRMEYGPRALGNRSILYRADDPSCSEWLNRKLKREYFMPFAPISLAEETPKLYNDIDKINYTLRFMNIAVSCTDEMKTRCAGAVHVDQTARPQIIYEDDNHRLRTILEFYRSLKGISVIINTSFNRHEEPIVCSPEDALRSFVECELDYLVLNNFLLCKENI